ncbi:hypothetical protein TD95_000280 [Thielaviopsis punctulata]|uniref:Cerato-platanin n=1 Tax=Thielaviopsis punctulata TaxID=72032 RepID=A0A0F4ZFD8_9PEZI|nr:hypothetical protein TD95_000280 [Thielaviopsis punctulata]
MKFSILSMVTGALAVSLSYDNTYDNAGLSLDSVACSDGANGLITKGYSTLGSLPNFPYVGGAPAVSGWNSMACGSCWQLSYNGKSIYVLAVDAAPGGFNVAEAAMNALTNNQAAALGRIEVSSTEVASSFCKM